MSNNTRSHVKSVRLRKATIQYYEQGAGEPIVFVHGLLVNGYLWRDVVPPLSGRFRCIVPDWPLGSHRLPCKADADLDPPGQARIIAEFLSELNLNNVTLVGNNTGGAVCQLVVTTYPERIARLVLTNCDAYENFLPPTFRPLQWVARVPGLIFLVAQSMRLDGVRRLPMAFGALTIKPIPSAVLDEYLGPVIHDAKIRRNVRKILLGISSKYTLEAASKFSQFNAPVLIAWGRDDPFFPSGHAVRFKNAFPNAQLEYVDDAAAFVPEDQPQRLAELIAAFITEHKTGEPVMTNHT
jgi:pimeloyl-ACP methyl ester carboxylesterase